MRRVLSQLTLGLLSLAVLLGVDKSCPAAEVLRGPYLQLATPESMTIVWRTDGVIAPVLRWGTRPNDLDQEVRGEAIRRLVSVDVAAMSDTPYSRAQLLYDEPLGFATGRGPGDRDPSTRPGVWQFEAVASSLKTATRYYYAIYDGDRHLAGGDEEHFFVTSPAAEAETDVRLWVVGDSGTGGRDQLRVFEAMRTFSESSSRRPDLFLHVGDMAYGDGADEEFQHHFFDVYQPTLCNTVCWPAMGNHEGHTSRGISQFGPYYDAYVLPTKAEAGGVASGTEAYYSFDVGKVHFVCLNSHDLDRSARGAMSQWLVADLEETTSDWLIAFWHHPPYTKGSHDSDYEQQLVEMRTFIMPLLESAGVDLVMSGHSHIYERSMLIDGAYETPTVAEGVVLDDGDGNPAGDGPYRKSAGLTPHNGTVAIVAGHGGAGVGRKGTMPIMREIIVDNGSLIVDLKGDTLTGTMIDKRGDERDQFQVVKRGVVEHSPIEHPWQPEHDPSLITEQRVAWTADDVGAAPKDWRILSLDDSRSAEASSDANSIVIEQRPGQPFYQAKVEALKEPTAVIYEGFRGATSECQSYLQFVAQTSAAGVILGWQDKGNFDSYELDPKKRRAAFYRTRGGERTLLSERTLEIDFHRPIKVELEPVSDIVEVQINDEIEYTINLDRPVAAGHVGVGLAKGAQINFAGLTIEKAQ